MSCSPDSILHSNFKQGRIGSRVSGIEACDLNPRLPSIQSLPHIVDRQSGRSVIVRGKYETESIAAVSGPHDALAGNGGEEQ